MNIERLPQPGENNLWFQYNDSDSVLVFLHGVLSDSQGCWLYEDRKDPVKNCYWPALIESDKRFNGISAYLAGYYTAPDSGPYEIRNCADEVFVGLKDNLDGHPSVMTKQRITFVCHSMGGIVARYLLEANQNAFQEKKVGLVLIASPSYGSTLANTLDNLITFINHRQGAQLKWGTWNLTDLDDRFKELKQKGRIPGLTGVELYENHFIVHYKWLPFFTRKLVVSKESAGRYFGAAKQIPRTDHFSICKPRKQTDLVHRYLFDFLSESELLPAVRLDTPLGSTMVSNTPSLQPSLLLVDTHTTFVHPAYRFELRWPLGGKWNRNDGLEQATGAVLLISYHQSFSGFNPNVNVTIEQIGSIRVQQWMDLGEATFRQLGWAILDRKFDESTQSGVRVIRNQHVAGVLFQIQRVIICRGFAYVATASKLESDYEVFPQLYEEVRQILNSFQVED